MESAPPPFHRSEGALRTEGDYHDHPADLRPAKYHESDRLRARRALVHCTSTGSRAARRRTDGAAVSPRAHTSIPRSYPARWPTSARSQRSADSDRRPQRSVVRSLRSSSVPEDFELPIKLAPARYRSCCNSQLNEWGVAVARATLACHPTAVGAWREEES